MDLESEAPVPVVNIGITAQMNGTVSGRDGSYRLAYRSESDSVLFSAIGYQSYKTTIEDLLEKKTVYLEQATSNLTKLW